MNKKLYRLVFSKKLGALVAVSETTVSQGKGAGETSAGGAVPDSAVGHAGYGLAGNPGEGGSCLAPLAFAVALAFVGVTTFSPTSFAQSVLPTGGVITTGSGTMATNGQTLTINQATPVLSANWQSFSIGAGNSVIFNQPSAASVAINRVIGNSQSQIYGNLQSNGQVFLINPNGVLFGKGAQVQVGALVATTKNITDAQINAGNYSFTGGSLAGIINQGMLTATASSAASSAANGAANGTANGTGGYVVLHADKVTNEGSIIANGGTITLAAGQTLGLSLDNGQLLSVQVTEAVANALVQNKGLIVAEGGQVYLTARGKDTLLNNVVNNEGIIRAHSISNKNGVIILNGGSQGAVVNSGTLDVAGKGNTKGGTVIVAGQYVALLDGSTVNASGDAGGGKVIIGGDLLQKATSLLNFSVAEKTVVQAGSQIDISSANGSGGFVETSGHAININGNLSGAGKTGDGQWLIDPDELVISSAPSTANNNNNLWTNSTGSIVNNGSISAALASSNVTLRTASGHINIGASVTSPRNWLILNSGDSIFGEGNLGGGMSVVFNTAGSTTDRGGYSGSFSGGGGLTKEGAGTLYFAHEKSDYTGVTNINGGALILPGFDIRGSLYGHADWTNKVININPGGTLKAGNFGNWGHNSYNFNTPKIIIHSGGTYDIGTHDTALSGLTLNGGRLIGNGLFGYLTLAGEIRVTASSEIRTDQPILLGIGTTVFNVASDVSLLVNARTTDKRADVISSLEKSGSGKLILNGGNYYRGTTTVNGTLQVGTGGSIALPPGDIILNDLWGGGLVLNHSNDITIDQSISGKGGLIKRGTGMLSLNQKKSNYEGVTNIEAGSTVKLLDQDARNWAGRSIQIWDGGRLEAGANENWGTTGVDRSPRITIHAGGTYSSGLSYFTSLVGLTLDGGTLHAAGGLGFNGIGSFVLSGVVNVTAPSRITASGNNNHITLGRGDNEGVVFHILNSSHSLEVDARLQNTYLNSPLEKTGGGTLILNAGSSHTGTTTVNGGSLQIGNGGNTPLPSNNIILNDPEGGLVLNHSNDLTLSQRISGVGGLIKRGTSTLFFHQNSSTYSGITNIEAGSTVKLMDTNATGWKNNRIHIHRGGTLLAGADNNWGTAAENETPVVAIGVGGTYSSGGFFTSLVNLTLAGGTLNANGGANSSYGSFGLSGVTTVSGNTSQILTSGNNSQINLGRNTNQTAVFNISNAGDSLRVDAVLQNHAGGASGSLVKVGGGTLILNASNTYSTTTIQGGTLQVGAGGTNGTLGTGSIGINNNAILSFNRSDAFPVNQLITGTGGLIQRGTGTLTVSNDNTYTGGTSAHCGTLVVTGNHTGGSRYSVQNGATMNISGNITLSQGGDLLIGTVANQDFSNTLSTLNINSGGSLTVLGGFAGIGGRASVGGGVGVVAAGNLLIDSGGTLTVGAGGTSAIGLDTGNFWWSPYIAAAASSLTLRGTLVLGRSLKAGTSASLNFMSDGGTLKANGTLANGFIQSGNATFNGSIGNGGLTVDTNGFSNTLLTDGAFLKAASANEVDGGLTKIGAGTLALSSNNTYTGMTNISGGALQVGAGGTNGTLGTGNISLNNAVLAFSRSNAINISQNIAITGDSTVAAFTSPNITLGGSITGTGRLVISTSQDTALASVNLTGGASSLIVNVSSGNLTLNGNLSAGGNITLLAGSALSTGAAANNVLVGTAQSIVANTAGAGGTVTIYSGTYDATNAAADAAQNTSAFQRIIAGADRTTTTKAYNTAANAGAVNVSQRLNVFYRAAPNLTIAALNSSKVYDMTNLGAYSVTGLVDGDTYNTAASGAVATFNTASAGTGLTINVTRSLVLDGVVSGYVNQTINATGVAISKAGVRANGILRVADKVYDTTVNATIEAASGFVVQLGNSSAANGALNGNSSFTALTTTGGFDNATAGVAKNVTISYVMSDTTNYTMSGSDSGALTATATISKASVTLTSHGTVSSKVFDSTTNAAVTANSSGVVALGNSSAANGSTVANSSFIAVNTTGGFSNASAGNQTVNLINALLDTDNYTIAGGGMVMVASAVISKANVSVASGGAAITVADKVYDGTTKASIASGFIVELGNSSTANGAVVNSNFTAFEVRGGFNNATAGVAKNVNITYSVRDTVNYTISGVSSGSTNVTASIRKAMINVTGGGAVTNKIYDGTTNATVASDGAPFSGVVMLGNSVAADGSTVATTLAGNLVSATNARFETNGSDLGRDVGSSKTVNFTYAATDSANYTVNGTAHTAQGSITPAANATWIGGANATNYTNPSNWQEGRIGDASNVLNIIITDNTTFTFGGATARDTTVQSLTGAGTNASFTQNSGNISVGGGTCVSGFTQTAGSFTSNGDLTVGSSFNQTGGTIKANAISLAGVNISSSAGSVINTTAGLTVNVSGDGSSLAGNITGGGGFTKLGMGMLSFAQANSSYTGVTHVNAGTLKLMNGFTTSSSATGWTAKVININSGGTLLAGDHHNWGDGSANATPLVTIHSGGTYSSGGFFTSLANLTLNGGTLNANGGGASIGAFALSGLTNVTATSQILASGTNAQIALGTNSNRTAVFNVVNASDSLLVNAVLQNYSGSQTSSLVKSGAGTLTLAGNNTYSGTTTVNSGTLQIGNGSSSGTLGAGVISVNDATLTFNRSNAITIGSITGSGKVVINANQETNLSSVHLSNTSGSSLTVNVSSGNLTLNGNLSAGGNITLLAGSALSTGAAADSGGNVRVGTAQNISANTAGAGGTVSIYSGTYQATNANASASQNTSAFQAIIAGANAITTTKAYNTSANNGLANISQRLNVFYRVAPNLTITVLNTSKVYDQTNLTAVGGYSVTGLVDGDTVNTVASGVIATYSTASAGTGLSINVTKSLVLNDMVSGYVVNQTLNVTGATISKANVSVNGTLRVADKVYDTTSTAIIANGFVVQLGNSSAANGAVHANSSFTTLTITSGFNNATAGVAKNVTLTYALSDTTNYTIAGGDTGSANGVANISKAGVTITSNGSVSSKVFDGTASALVTAHSSGVVALGNSTLANGSTAASSSFIAVITTTSGFTNASAGSQTVNLSNALLDTVNYTLASGSMVTNALGAAISKAGVTITSHGTVSSKVFDTTTSALVTAQSTGTVALGNSSLANGSTAASSNFAAITTVGASFTNASAGSQTVNLTHALLDTVNYTIAGGNVVANAAGAAISKADVRVDGAVTVADKVYDTTTKASIATGFVVQLGNSSAANGTTNANSNFTTLTTTGGFNNATAGTAKNVTLTYALTDTTNYTISGGSGTGSASGTANISKASVTITSHGSVSSKVFDGTANAAVTANSSGVVALGDRVLANGHTAANSSFTAINTTGAIFTNASAGNQTVNLTSALLDTVNYTLVSGSVVTNATSAVISKAGVTITSNGTVSSKVFDTTTSALVTAHSAGVVALGDSALANGSTAANSNFTAINTMSASFTNASAGSQTVNLSNALLDTVNYTITSGSVVTSAMGAIISKASVTITSNGSVSSKVFDTTTSALVTAHSAGVVALGDRAVANGSLAANSSFTAVNTVGSFTNASAGSQMVNLTSALLDTVNYTIASGSVVTGAPGATISKAGVSVNGTITVADKVYDTTTNASIASGFVVQLGNSSAANGAVNANSNFTTLTITGGFENATAGIAKNANITYLLSDTANYTLSGGAGAGSANATANISKASVTITTNGSVSSKVFDTTTRAVVTANSTGIVTLGDSTQANGSTAANSNFTAVSTTGSFTNASAGSQTVNLSNALLDTANYTLASGSMVTNATGASISKAVVNITGGATGIDKTYDGNANAALNTSSLSGVVYLGNVTTPNGSIVSNNLASSGNVTLNGSFLTRDVGNNKNITISYALVDTANYTLTSAVAANSTTANITMVANNSTPPVTPPVMPPVIDLVKQEKERLAAEAREKEQRLFAEILRRVTERLLPTSGGSAESGEITTIPVTRIGEVAAPVGLYTAGNFSPVQPKTQAGGRANICIESGVKLPKALAGIDACR